MTLIVKMFGPLAAAAGAGEVAVHPESLPLTCAALRQLLPRQIPAIASLLPVCRFAINHAYAAETQLIHPQDEVALIGLVSGG